MLKLWIKTFGREFFAQHAGLLIFIFYLVFGAVPANQIKGYISALCITINSSPIAMGIVMLIMFLFSMKCLFFVQKKINTPLYNFVKASCAASKRTQLQNWYILYLFLHSPLAAFSLLIIATGLYTHSYLSAALLGIFSILVLSSLTIFTFHSVNYSFKPTKQRIFFPEITIKKPYWTWPIYYILKEQPLTLVVCKVLSFLLFKGIIWMFADLGSDIRIYLLSLMAATISHCILISLVFRYEKSYGNFVNSLPVNYWYRLTNLLIFLLLLLAPELFFYSNLSGFFLIPTLSGILLCTGILFILKMSLYFVEEDAERYLKYIFILVISSIMAIIAGQFFPFSILLLASGIIYHHYLYQRNRL